MLGQDIQAAASQARAACMRAGQEVRHDELLVCADVMQKGQKFVITNFLGISSRQNFWSDQPRCQPPRHVEQSEPEPATRVKPMPRASANENRTHTLNGCVSMSVSTSKMSLPRKPSSQAAAGELIDSGQSTNSWQRTSPAISRNPRFFSAFKH